jgi:nucleoside 2-deoxyribosyltransferase
LDDLIRDQIRNADFLAADVTYLNCNVLYEIGFAVAAEKPIIVTIDTAVEKAIANLMKIGLFDTLGWVPYNNSLELFEKLQSWTSQVYEAKGSRPAVILRGQRSKDRF